ncbi:MAG: stage II sporulation protein P [Candidatus Fermentithermobacillus carboniphilus]|uniref:Stage II sporulation protein P n=1 Tax=Candidatus Fermentithermobacillus carboniphilus TaxID=3085328 RepID=A0AAT9LCI2_9FIRM|nr:MAG: stage II sporulation protein P [Candidatus Fermentithermobacillus carboniphilus]
MQGNRRALGFFVIVLVFGFALGYYYQGYRLPRPTASTDLSGHVEREDGYYTVVDESGKTIFTTGHAISVGDEFISEDDTRYTITRISGDVATAKAMGKMEALPPLPSLGAATKGGTVAIYHTHSDESYIPTDGTDAIPAKGGVLRVGAAMADMLRRVGFKAVHDTTSHDPHDAQAYNRSRRTASRLLRSERPLALFDVHRDAGPAEPYLKEVDGREVARGMIVIGRQNPKMQSNLEFARRLKDAVNREYPGLIKGIFLGKADFNQDLFDRSLLLEVGTEKTTREAAEAGVALIARVVPGILGATGPGAIPENRGAGRAIGWFLGVVVAGIFVYLWVSTGSWEEMKAKILGWFGTGGVRIGRGRGGGSEPGGTSDNSGEDRSS